MFDLSCLRKLSEKLGTLLLKLSAVTGGALAMAELWPGIADAAEATTAAADAATPTAAQGAATPAPFDVLLRVNGGQHRLALDPRTTLLDALREHLHLTGSKKGCGLKRRRA